MEFKFKVGDRVRFNWTGTFGSYYRGEGEVTRLQEEGIPGYWVKSDPETVEQYPVTLLDDEDDLFFESELEEVK